MLARTELTEKYLELLKKSLLNQLYIENEAKLVHLASKLLQKREITYQDLLAAPEHDSFLSVLEGIKETGDTISLAYVDAEGATRFTTAMRDVTELSHTMVGKARLENIQYCVETALEENIPGDIIETGVWRGGATIFMRGILAAYGVTDRKVWVADSFEGLPVPSHEEDAGFDISASKVPVLAVGLGEVMELFDRYDLFDDQVNFVKGWFKESLPGAPIDKLAVLRLDGDMYESTMDALNPLYHKVSPGGFIIVDDYHSCPPCKRAIDHFRAEHGITEEMVAIDGHSVYWRKN